MGNKLVGEITLRGITLWGITLWGITLWGRDALLRVLTINFAGDSADKLCWGILMMNSAGDGLPLLVTLDLLRVELMFGERKELCWGDDLSISTC